MKSPYYVGGVVRVYRAALDLIGERPTIDFALLCLALGLELPEEAAITIFALGRTVGWLAHAIEQYRANTLIRPRARYVGPPPQDIPGKPGP